jgi:hypothetical protein
MSDLVKAWKDGKRGKFRRIDGGKVAFIRSDDGKVEKDGSCAFCDKEATEMVPRAEGLDPIATCASHVAMAQNSLNKEAVTAEGMAADMGDAAEVHATDKPCACGKKVCKGKCGMKKNEATCDCSHEGICKEDEACECDCTDRATCKMRVSKMSTVDALIEKMHDKTHTVMTVANDVVGSTGSWQKIGKSVMFVADNGTVKAGPKDAVGKPLQEKSE